MGIDLSGSVASPREARHVRRLWILPPLLLGAAVLISVLAYPHLPQEMPTHWGVSGQPTNLMPRRFAVSVIPGIMVWIGFITGLILWSASQARDGRDLPAWLSPVLTSGTLAFLLLIHAVVIAAALGWGVDIPLATSLAAGLLFVALGLITPRVPPNPVFGIRTSRTLACPDAWERANRVGGRWMLGAGVVTMLAAALPGAWPIAIMALALVVACIAGVMASRSTGDPAQPRSAG